VFHDILDTQAELLKVKWLHEIVISTERESLDLIDLLVECGEEEKWYLDRPRLHHTYERESIDLRDHTIDDEKVVLR
jgi:hypothetical protein